MMRAFHHRMTALLGTIPANVIAGIVAPGAVSEIPDRTCRAAFLFSLSETPLLSTEWSTELV